MKTIVGLFDTFAAADQAVAELVRHGYHQDEIAVITREYVVRERETTATSGTAEGAAGGAVVGGLAGLLTGLGVIALPGIGPVIAAGTLAAILSSTAIGAGVGAAAGGLVGALVDLGIDKDEARVYAEGVKRGGVLLAIKPRTEEGIVEVTSILQEYGAVDVTARRQAWLPAR